MTPAVQLRTGEEPYPGYRLRRLIGRGGFAEVWAAQTADGRPVALKFLPAGNRRAISREVRALQVVQNLHHPNLVRVERIWCHLGYIVVAMELADGSLQDVRDVFRKDFGTPVNAELVCQFLRQAAAAIDFLNLPCSEDGERRAAIHHGDVKPSNLLLFGDTVKLADFGLASLKAAHAIWQTPAGTLAYAAPEVYQGRVSDRTDQFALAVTYCELRGGRLPFPNAPPGFRRHYVPPPPDLTMLTAREVPVIARALSPMPADRWPSCTEMMDRLSQVVG